MSGDENDSIDEGENEDELPSPVGEVTAEQPTEEEIFLEDESDVVIPTPIPSVRRYRSRVRIVKRSVAKKAAPRKTAKKKKKTGRKIIKKTRRKTGLRKART